MDIKLLSALEPDEWEWVHTCWNAENPVPSQMATKHELEKSLNLGANPRHYLIKNDGLIQGWALTFDSQIGREFLILVDGAHQSRGIGSKLVKTMQTYEPVLNSWIIDQDIFRKANGAIYYSPLMFYLKHGFMVLIDERTDHFGIEKTRINWVSNSKF